MSNAGFDPAYIASMQYATIQMNIYLPTIFLVSGLIGNILNCLIFFQRSFRSKPCVVLFLVASIANLIGLLSSVLPRFLQSFFAIPDQTETVSLFCKMRLIALFTARTVASWLIALASIDRYLVSSRDVRRRRWSNLKNTYWSILIVTILSCLVWAEVGYCFDANQIGTPQKCYAKSDSCRAFNDLSQAFVTTLIPSLIMFIFGWLTIRNVRYSQRIVQTALEATQHTIARTKKDERGLTIMLIVQILFLTIFSLPLAGQKFYITVTFYHSKTPNQRALESFVFALVVQLLTIPACISFYLYTLTGKVFRQSLVKLVQNSMMHLKCFK